MNAFDFFVEKNKDLSDSKIAEKWKKVSSGSLDNLETSKVMKYYRKANKVKADEYVKTKKEFRRPIFGPKYVYMLHMGTIADAMENKKTSVSLLREQYHFLTEPEKKEWIENAKLETEFQAEVFNDLANQIEKITGVKPKFKTEYIDEPEQIRVSGKYKYMFTWVQKGVVKEQMQYMAYGFDDVLFAW